MARIIKIAGSPPKPYEVRWSWNDANGRRHFKSARFRTKQEALTHKAKVEVAASGGAATDYTRGREAFHTWAEEWLATKKLKPSTLRGYRTILDHSVLPVFGTRRLRSLVSDDVQAFINAEEARGLTPPTVRHHYGVVRAVLGFAVRRKAIPVNVALDVELKTEKASGRLKPEPRFLTPAQIAALAEVLDAEPPYGLLVRFAAYTGLRAGELAGLNIGDVNILRRTVHVVRTRRKIKAAADNPTGWEIHTPKSGKGRTVPLPPWLAEDLDDYLTEHPHRANPDAPLWPGRVNGDPTRFRGGHGRITYDAPWERDAFYKRHFKPALAAAGLPADVRLHDLRHTYASICASEGIPAYRVAKAMGHANEGITRAIYTHLFDEDVSDDMARLARPTVTRPSTTVARLPRTPRANT